MVFVGETETSDIWAVPAPGRLEVAASAVLPTPGDLEGRLGFEQDDHRSETISVHDLATTGAPGF